MCGRARCTLRPDDFSRACHLNGRPVRHLNMNGYRPSYNVAPGFNVPVVRRDDGEDSNGVVLHCMKWGLIPSFTKKTEKPDYFRMFNARSESIREKASFRRLLPNNRCLVSVEGFYEWKKDGPRKQPYYIHLKDGRPLVFAALFDSWKNSDGEELLYTFTIVTTSSSSSLEWLHDRMPVILGNKESTDRWLNDSSLSNLDKLLKPYEEADLAWYPVTPAMGKLSCDGSECIKEVKVEETKSITQFFSKDLRGSKEPNLEKTTIKEEPIDASEPKSMKKEPESQSKFDNTRMKEEPAEANQPKSVIEEPEPQDDYHQSQDDYHQSITKRDGNYIKSDFTSTSSKGVSPNIPMKRDHEEFSANAKPIAKETNWQHTSPVRKKGKGTTDKQPTLFSYFGRS